MTGKQEDKKPWPACSSFIENYDGQGVKHCGGGRCNSFSDGVHLSGIIGVLMDAYFCSRFFLYK